MKRPALFRFAPILALSTLAVATAEALTVQLDYSYDSFFNQNPMAKAALEAAANDISIAITSTLGALSSSDYTVTGVNGDTSVTFEWSYTITNPTTGEEIILNGTEIAANTVIIYAGMQPIAGGTLGQGGMGGIGYSLNGGGFESEWGGAMASAEEQSNTLIGREGGPDAYLVEGSSTLGSTTASFSVSTGLGVGNLWLDNDIDNNGSPDSIQDLEAFWHFDHTTGVDPGKFDFYSVALHEILHSIGMGQSFSWASLVDGNDWRGEHAIRLYGTGTNLISGGDHIAGGVMSHRLSDGLSQEVVMSPSLTTGQRKELTQLDVAFLNDIGWQSAEAIPEPQLPMLAAFGLSLTLGIRRRCRR